jgi:hypothetical protein
MISGDHLRKHGFPKGVSGNPGGRSKAEHAVDRLVPKLIADLTNNCADLVHLLLRIAAGSEPGMEDAKSRTFAIRELLDRGVGKAPQFVMLADAPVQPLDDRDLTDDELRVLAKMDIVPPAPVLQLVPGGAPDGEPRSG